MLAGSANAMRCSLGRSAAALPKMHLPIPGSRGHWGGPIGGVQGEHAANSLRFLRRMQPCYLQATRLTRLSQDEQRCAHDPPTLALLKRCVVDARFFCSHPEHCCMGTQMPLAGALRSEQAVPLNAMPSSSAYSPALIGCRYVSMRTPARSLITFACETNG